MRAAGYGVFPYPESAGRSLPLEQDGNETGHFAKSAKTHSGARGAIPAASNNRHLHATLDDTGGDGVAGEAGGVVNIEFLHDALPVFLDGFYADVKLLG